MYGRRQMTDRTLLQEKVTALHFPRSLVRIPHDEVEKLRAHKRSQFGVNALTRHSPNLSFSDQSAPRKTKSKKNLFSRLPKAR